MTDREVMQMALDALERADKISGHSNNKKVIEALRAALAKPNEFNPDWDAMAVMVEEQQRLAKKVEETTDALQAALKAEKQEPVVWMYQDKSTNEVRFQKHMRAFVDHGATYEMPLYAAPPQRPWVGLTDEERRSIREHQELLEKLGPVWAPMLLYYYLAIEAKLKEKNT